MDNLYAQPSNPGALSGVERYFKQSGQKATRTEVNEYLSGVPAYTLHKPRRYKFQRNKFIIKGIDDLWQADLADLSGLSHYNDGVRYILVVIDSFSKFMWVQPIKRKTADVVHAAIKLVFEDAEPRKPVNFMVDKGGEFRNSTLKKFMVDLNVNFYTTKNPDTKAAIAERSIRTLKGRIYRYLTANNTRRFVDHLEDMVSGYNNAVHRSIGMSPAEVNEENESLVRRRLYPGRVNRNYNFPFKVGDMVRLAKESTPFQKGYLPLWTEELFRVINILPREPPVAQVEDMTGEPIEGTFYKQEMQKVRLSPTSTFRIQEVIETRKDENGNDQHLVRWLGYPESMNSWVNDDDITLR